MSSMGRAAFATSVSLSFGNAPVGSEQSKWVVGPPPELLELPELAVLAELPALELLLELPELVCPVLEPLVLAPLAPALELLDVLWLPPFPVELPEVDALPFPPLPVLESPSQARMVKLEPRRRSVEETTKRGSRRKDRMRSMLRADGMGRNPFRAARPGSQRVKDSGPPVFVRRDPGEAKAATLR
jgi:hypothetical protein